MSSPVMLLSTYAYLESKYVLRKGHYISDFFKLILGILQPKNNKKS